MPAGLINIVSYGAYDLYLTGAPQITFFKIIYRRYTNFSKESILIPLNGLDFDNTTEVELPPIGDLLGELYFQVKVPTLSFLKSDIGLESNTTIDTTAATTYDIILQFMKMNVEAYRVAYSDYQAIGLPPNIMANDIIGVFSRFTSSPDVIAAYREALYDVNQTLNYSWLDPAQTDISEIINDISAELSDNPESWTNEKILGRLQTAIQLSVKVQGFFFDKLMTYNKQYAETASEYASFSWVEKLGHAMIDYIDINVGGERIDRHYGIWIDIWHELTCNYDQKEMYNRMIGNVPEMITFNNSPKPEFTITVPLSFWFCRKSGLSIPLIALRYNNISLTIKLRKIEDCSYVQKNPDMENVDMIALSDIWEDKGYSLTGSILADYVFLDTLERKRFAQSAHEYLIERVQEMTIENVDSEKISINLDFRSPCKELIWIVQKDAYINNTTNYYKSLWTNYGLDAQGNGNPIKTAQMDFNGYNRARKSDGSYYNYVQPYAAHTNTPTDGINVFTFGLLPEEYQPSSSCNFSRIASAMLYLQFEKLAFYYYDSDIDPSIMPSNTIKESPHPAIWQYSKSNPDTTTMKQTTLTVRLFMTSYNIFRCIGGMGAIAYR